MPMNFDYLTLLLYRQEIIVKKVLTGISLLLFIVSTAYSNGQLGSTDEMVQSCDHSYQQGEEITSDCYIPFIYDRMEFKLPTTSRKCSVIARVEVCTSREKCSQPEPGATPLPNNWCLTTCVNNPDENKYGCTVEPY